MAHGTKISVRRLLGCIGVSLTILAAGSGGARAQTSPPADTTKIVLGQDNTGIQELPIYVALQGDFFSKAGVDVTGVMLSGGTPSAMAAFASGSVNILDLSAPELVEYAGKKVIAGKGFAEVIDSNYEVVASKGITSIQDIKGKTVGISGPNSADWLFFIGVMLHYGIPSNDVTFITAGNPTNRLAALAAGSIQFSAATADQRAVSDKVGNVILKSEDSPVKFPGKLFIASNDLLNNHKPVLKKFLGAISAAIAWMQANPAAAAADCAKLTGATAAECTVSIAAIFNRSITSPYTWSSTSAINVEGIKATLATMATIQADTKNLVVEDVVDTSLVGTVP